MMPDCVKNLRGNAGISLQHFIPGRGMGFDQCTLPCIEAPRLIQDRERNFRLANVVKHRSRVQTLNVRLRQTKAQSEIDSYSRNQKAVLIGSLMVTPNRLEPAAQPVLFDAVCNPAACAFSIPEIDGLAGQHGGEHRSYGSRPGTSPLRGRHAKPRLSQSLDETGRQVPPTTLLE